MKIVLFIILIIATFFSLLLFNDKGNELLKPYLSSYLSYQIKQAIEIEELKINMGKIEATALINEIHQLKIDGNFSLLTQTVELNYQLQSKSIEAKEFDLQGDIDINGTAKGSIDNINIEGKGDAFKFDIAYNFILNKKKIHALKFNIDKAETQKILTMMKQPSFAKGEVDILVHIPLVDKNISKGTVDIKLYETLLNEKVLDKEFDLTIPPNTKLTAKINSRFHSNVLKLQGDIKTNLGTLSFKDANYNLKDKKLHSDYQIDTKEPKTLYPLTLNGEIDYQDKKFILKGSSSSLGGVTQLLVEENQLKTTFRDVQMEKVLKLLGEKSYVRGLFDANLVLSDIKTKKGTFTIKSKTLKTVNATFKKEFDIRLTQAVKLRIEAEGNIDKDTLLMKTKLLSDILNITSHKLQYHLKTASLAAPYSLNIPDLKKCRSLIKQPLSGQMKIRGEIRKDRILQIKGITNNLGGEVIFNLRDDNVRVNLKSVSTIRLMRMLNYPQTFKGKLFGNINYNLKDKKGEINTELKQAQLLPNNITNIIQNLRGVDLTKERYNHSVFVAKINHPNIDFDFYAKSKTSNISLHHAHLDQDAGLIDAKYSLVIEEKDISGTLKGGIHDPKITIDSSKFLEQEIDDTLKKLGIGEEQKQIISDTMEEIGIGKEEKDMIKDMFKKLF